MSPEQSTVGGIEIAIAVVEREGQFLIGLRPAGAPLAGYWEFPGGKIAQGETPEDAACRECLEETGVTVRVISEYPPATFDYPHGRVLLRFFGCQAIDLPRPLPPRFRWVPAADLPNYHFPPANDELLRALSADKSFMPKSTAK